MASDIPRALTGLVNEHDYAEAEKLHISTVRRWAKRGWLVVHEHGRSRDVDVPATLELWRSKKRKRGRPPKAVDPRQLDLLTGE